MSRIIYIYVLKTTANNSVRYVGKTTNLKIRLAGHIFKTKSFKGSRKIYNWITNVLKKGNKPIIEAVEICNESNWPEREKYWIAYYRNLGCNLCNLTDGGESNYGYKATESTKKLQSSVQRERHKLNPASNETRTAIAKTLSKEIICINTGEIFSSLKIAASTLGVSKSTFHRRFHKKETIKDMVFALTPLS